MAIETIAEPTVAAEGYYQARWREAQRAGQINGPDAGAFAKIDQALAGLDGVLRVLHEHSLSAENRQPLLNSREAVNLGFAAVALCELASDEFSSVREGWVAAARTKQ